MRIYLFELEDQAWLPSHVRGYMTDYLALLAELGAPAYAGIGARIARGATRLGVQRVIELGAGAGGASVVLSRVLREHVPDLRYVLTDLYPSPAVWAMRREREPALEWRTEPVDATAAPTEPGEYRVLCNCFHHFAPVGARRVLRAAWMARAPIAVVELLQRSPLGLLAVLSGLVLMPFLTPFVRPFSVGRLALTYVLPLVPLCMAWDGLVSWLRIYSARELEDLVSELRHEAYRWEIGELNGIGRLGRVSYLIGEPISSPEASDAGLAPE